MKRPPTNPAPKDSPPPPSWMRTAEVLRGEAQAQIEDRAWRRAWTLLLEGLEEEDLDLPAALESALRRALGGDPPQ